MEKEENQNSTSTDQKQDTMEEKENEKPEENLVEENKQETDQEPKKVKFSQLLKIISPQCQLEFCKVKEKWLQIIKF